MHNRTKIKPPEAKIEPNDSPRSELWAGIRAQLPIMLGVVPFGLIYGALAIQLNVPAPIAQAMSWIIFAGSSQFVAAPLIMTTPALIVIITVLVVNLRHALYSASIAPHIKPLHPIWKILLAYLLTDEAYAVAITHYAEGTLRNKHWYFLGAGLCLWLGWQVSTAAGLYVGAQVPPSWSLDFAVPLTFIALVVPMVKDRSFVFAALVASAVGVLAIGLPYKLGLVLAAVLGIAAGMAATSGARRFDAGKQPARQREEQQVE